MTTRRNVGDEKTVLENDPRGPPGPSNITPAVDPSVIWKLLGFTFAMATLPISSYFFSVKFVFQGNATYAGGFAALMANVVLMAYVVMAFKDDQAEQAEEAQVLKKEL